jgi:hypothetical protein
MAMAEEQVELELEDPTPEVVVEEAKEDVKEPEKKGKMPEEGIDELKRMLEAERELRAEAERIAKKNAEIAQFAAEHAQKAEKGIQDSNLQLIVNAIDTFHKDNDNLKSQIRDALSAGDYDKAADLQSAMSMNNAKLLQLENGKAALQEKLAQPVKPLPPMPTIQRKDAVEELASQLSPRSAAWIRAHPECAQDSKMFNKMVGAHNFAIGEGYIPDSDAYFDYIESQLGFKQPKNDVSDTETLSAASAPSQSRSAPPPAPSSRAASGSGRPNVVRLSQQEREMAQMMGMSPEDYAKNRELLRKEGKLG